MKKIICTALFVLPAVLIISCGSSKKAAIDDPGLQALLGDKDYASLSAADKYEIAQYFMRRGNLNRARMVYEEILELAPSAVGVKYKLAMIYLKMDTVFFVKYDKKNRPVSTSTADGPELGNEMIENIRSEHPDFLPIYSASIIRAMENEDTAAVRQIYAAAKEKDPAYSLGDYRLGYLSVWDISNSNRYSEGIAGMQKAQTTFQELYDAYKQLGNIQKVQGMDTLAYASYLKALKYRTEAFDLFDLYYEFADVCYEIYRKRNVEKFKIEALGYACQSLQHFAGYKPSVELIRSLSGKTGKVVPDSVAVRDAEDYCRNAGTEK